MATVSPPQGSRARQRSAGVVPQPPLHGAHWPGSGRGSSCLCSEDSGLWCWRQKTQPGIQGDPRERREQGVNQPKVSPLPQRGPCGPRGPVIRSVPRPSHRNPQLAFPLCYSAGVVCSLLIL